ncbi:hypothetical protein GCM10022280_17450 [Sphingomonas swuensis]|uniref:Lipoprotein n=2 Tax=Sphingomonas swuensis TaxID=977800 RepID=A0ABP7SYY5_9SPHN
MAACRQEEAAPAAETVPDAAAAEVYASGPRDRLCLKPGEQRAGIITFAKTGDSNCSVRGSITNPQAIRPDGDTTCAILYNRDGDTLTLLTGDNSCAYYCGPGASLEGKTFVRMDNPMPVTDIAGDPLC